MNYWMKRIRTMLHLKKIRLKLRIEKFLPRKCEHCKYFKLYENNCGYCEIDRCIVHKKFRCGRF